jgi:hypothetical protein
MWPPPGNGDLLAIPSDIRLKIACFVLLVTAFLATVSFAGSMNLSTVIALFLIEVATVAFIWAACRYVLHYWPVNGVEEKESLLGTTPAVFSSVSAQN